jgi:chemotaxis protein MotB
MKKNWLWMILPLLGLGACVTTERYDQKVAELSACQDERLALQEKAKAELDAGFVAQQELEAGLTGMKGEYEACKKAADEARQYGERLKQRETDLRSRLQKELTDKDVEISRLKDQLSVSVLDKILFKSGSADILPAGLAVLEKVARVLVATDDMVRVEGHTDDVPIGAKLKDKYFSNWELSAARAASVVRFFQGGEHQLDPRRLEAVGYAEYRPVAANDSDANRQRNRRVEIILTAVKPANAPEAAPPAQP